MEKTTAYASMQFADREFIDNFFRRKNKMNFFKKLFFELIQNGKMLITYLLMNVPELTDYPMLQSAIQDFFENPSRENLTKLLLQVALAGSAGHRIFKIVKKVLL